MAQTEDRLPGVHAGAEQLELKGCLKFSKTGRQRSLYTEPALPDAGEPVSVFPELVFESCQLGGTHHIKPGGVVLPYLIARVQHGETIDVQLRLWLSGWRRRLSPC